MEKMSRKAVAAEIEQFLSGTGGAWDWDDFLSCPLQDPELERIRETCASLPELYPVAANSAYCSEKGLALLKQILENLRSSGD